MPSPTLNEAQWKSLPKVLLHEHLDGGLRPQTLLELCQIRNVAMPASTADDLAAWLLANSNSGSLERYLTGFGLTVAATGAVPAVGNDHGGKAHPLKTSATSGRKTHRTFIIVIPVNVSTDATY